MEKSVIGILLIEDNESDIILARRMLAHNSQSIKFFVESVKTLSDALKQLNSSRKFDAILLDMGLPDSSGVETVRCVTQADPCIPAVVLTGMDDEETGRLAIQNGASDYLVKGQLSSYILTRTIIFAMERKQTEEERNRMLKVRQGINLLQQSLLSITPLEQKLKKVTDDVVKLFKADFCRIWLIKNSDLCGNGCLHAEKQEEPYVCKNRNQCLHLIASSGRYTNTNGKMYGRVPLGSYKLGMFAFGEEHKLLTNDVQNAPNISDPQWAKDIGLMSFASYQLRVEGGQTLGVLALFSKNQILASDDAMLDGISSAVAMAVHQSNTSGRLRESESRYRGLFENSRDAMMTIEPPLWKFTSCNPAALKLFKIESKEQFISLCPCEISPLRQSDSTLSEEKVKEVIQKALDEGSTYFEWTHKRIDGEEFPATVLLNKIELGGKVFIQATVRDISKFKQVETALRQNAALLSNTFTAAPICIMLVTNRIINKANGRVLEMLGYTVEELVGQLSQILYSSQEEYEKVGAELYKDLGTVGTKTLETSLRRKDGSIVYVQLSTSLIDQNNPDAGAVVTVVDITKSKRAEAALRQNATLLNSAFTAAPICIVLRKNGLVSRINGRIFDISGYTAEELAGKPSTILYPDEAEHQRAMNGLYKNLKPGETRTLEAKWRHKDGRIINIQFNASLLDAADPGAGEVITVMDITESRRAETALRQSATVLSSTFSAAPICIMLLNKRIINKVNGRITEISGYTSEELLGKSARMLYSDDAEYSRVGNELYTDLRLLGTKNTEAQWRHKDGRLVYVQLNSSLLDSNNPEVGEVVTVFDITERKEAEVSLKFQKMLLESQSEASMDGILNVDTKGKIVWFNRRFLEMWQIPKEVIQTGSDDANIRYVQDKVVDSDAFVAKISKLYANPDAKGRDEIYLKDGRVFERYTAPVIGEGNCMLGRIWVFHDFTTRKRAEEGLRRERNKAQNYLNVAGVMMLVLNDDLTVHQVNSKGCEILGFAENEILGKSWCDCFVPQECRSEVYYMLQELLEGEMEKYKYYENPVLTKDGRQRLIAWHHVVLRDEAGKITSVLSSGEDITERKEAEEGLKKAYNELEKVNADLKNTQAQLIQSEKMASIGQLAAGVAHEMNTPVGFTASNFETLEKYVDKFKKLIDLYGKTAADVPNMDKEQIVKRCVDIKNISSDLKIGFVLEDIDALFAESKEGLKRVTTIIQNLRDFSRIDQIGTYDEFDIRKGMESTLAVARNTIKYSANVTVEFADVPRVPCNASQINQVFLNILVNAAQAIESKKQGMGNIKVKIYSNETYVVCEIEDDGPGISQENMKKIYDPFFTTKPAGKGTGLGLSVSYDIIVNKHKGELAVDSEIGRGTKFMIKLPLAKILSDVQKEMFSDGKENNIICR